MQKFQKYKHVFDAIKAKQKTEVFQNCCKYSIFRQFTINKKRKSSFSNAILPENE